MSHSPSSRRPNVLFIVTDDHQYDALGALGHPAVRTPVLDALAARGALFARAATMGSLVPAVCSPARACLLTGGNLMQANVVPRLGAGSEDFVSVPERMETLPQLFRGAGYETFITGKWHNDLAALQRSFSQGRRIFHGGMCEHTRVPERDLAEIARGGAPRIATGFSTELFCGAAADFIRQGAGRQPFFVWLALTSPHDPRTPPPKFRELYPPERLPLPPGFRAEPAFDNGELKVRDELLAPKPLTPEILREHLADYYGMISHQDAEIGRVLEAVRAAGIEQETLVVYVGDHGLALGRHGLLGKQNLYEHSVRVPMILAGPGVPAGVRPEGLAYSLDLFATVLELAGLPAPAGRESASLVPLCCLAERDPSASGRDELFALYRDCQRMVRRDRWKLIEYCVSGRRRLELFDLHEDPHEQVDRSADPECQELVGGLRERIVAWQRRLGDGWMPSDPGVQPAFPRR